MQKERANERIEILSPMGEEKVVLFDLSSGGACCLHDKVKANGSIVVVKINSLVLRSKVVYSVERKDGSRLGVQFLDVPADKQKTLSDLVEQFSRGVPLTCSVEDEPATKKA